MTTIHAAPRIKHSPKRVRAMLGGDVVVDADAPLMVWEIPYYPTYFFPRSAVRPDLLEPGGPARTYDGPSEGQLDDHVAFTWADLDHWFEEDDEVFVHARDPYHRVDVLTSSRRVQVEVAGQQIADSVSPVLLFETGLLTRYYLPKVDVRMDLLRESSTSTGCPYKGTARYWGVEVDGDVHEDLAWSYDFPTRESLPIAGLVCFYNEHVDITVDGVALGRPDSPFKADKFA